MQERHLFTSESVTEGHPDKIADQISDAILDAMLEKDPNSRVACETTVTTGLVLVVGEISTNAYVDIQSVVRGTIKKIGYTKESGFDPDSVGVLVALDEQSPDIAQGVDESLEARDSDTDPLDKIGAGDQGMMFGFAIDETDTYMPLPISLAHALMRQTDKLRHAGEISYLRPDAKAQVTVEYDDNEQPVRVDTVVLSVQHDPDVTLEEIRRDVEAKIIRKIIPADMMGPFPVRMRRRLTALLVMQRVILLKILLQPAWPNAWKCNWLMRLALLNRCRYLSTHLAPTLFLNK